MRYMFDKLLWIWREPAPPIATYDNTPEKWERAFRKRKDWLESKPMRGISTFDRERRTASSETADRITAL